jgi:hypothetical protein
MLFGGRTLNELTIQDLETLVQNHIPEGPHLEYKETAYGGSDDKKREMLRDIIAIANAHGGYLIMGIREGLANRAEVITPISDIHAKVQPIRQTCLDGIRDRIEGLEVAAFETALNEGLIVIHIPPSQQRPHMVSHGNHTDFLRRYGTDRRPMTVDEIRSVILTNPPNQRLVELELLASGKVVKPGQGKKAGGPPYVRIFTEKSVEQFLQKYLACSAFPQTLVIVSPFISELEGELVDLNDLVEKIGKDKTTTYVITRQPKARYQQESMEILRKCPYTEIRYNEDIHAKLYICWCRKNEEESFAMFGSGNLTRGGIRHNLELGMMIYARDHGRSLIRELYDWSTAGLRSQSKRVKAAIRN